jgi:hypothetical protein
VASLRRPNLHLVANPLPYPIRPNFKRGINTAWYWTPSLHRRLTPHGHGGLAVRVSGPIPGRERGPTVRRATREGPVSTRGPGLLWPVHRARALGQEAAHDREQRVVRDHPHTQLRVRRYPPGR